MESREQPFFSDGLQIDARFYLPDDLGQDERRPLVLVCSGFTGLSRIHPERFARWLTRRGYICFGFDYRGYGESEGPRHRVLLDEQVRDIRNAVTIASASRQVDSRNVFLLGWAMGGGLIIDAARELEPLRAICALNGLYDGADFELAHRGIEGMAEFRSRVRDERYRRARTGIAEFVDPWDVYPLDEATRAYVASTLESVEGYSGTICSFELAESLLRWSVMDAARQLTLPLFMAHGEHNNLHPARQAVALEGVYGGRVDVLWLKGAGHTEWMTDDDPVFLRLCSRLHEWLQGQIAPLAKP